MPTRKFQTLVTFSFAKIQLSSRTRGLFASSAPKLSLNIAKFPPSVQERILNTDMSVMHSFEDLMDQFDGLKTEEVHEIYTYFKDIFNKYTTSVPTLPSDTVANVPLKEIQERVPIIDTLPSPLTREMVMGITAWTHKMSELAQMIARHQPLRELEAQLYHGVVDFAQRASENPAFRISQEHIHRAINLESNPWLQQIIQNPPAERSLRTGVVVPYSKPTQDPPIITFAPITSWTLYDLTIPSSFVPLGRSYDKLLKCDVIFVARNANVKRWGSVIGQLSCVPKEKEIVIAPGTQAKVTAGAHYFRPKLLIDLDPMMPNTPSARFQEEKEILRIPPQIIHIIYVDFVDSINPAT